MKYVDVGNGEEGFNLVVQLSGGGDANIETSFMVFVNRESRCSV